MANGDLLHTTLRHIQDGRESWDQTVWRAGNRGCFAFHAARLAGAVLEDPEPTITWGDGSIDPNDDVRVVVNDAARALGYEDGDFISINLFARRALKLSDEQAAELFCGCNGLADLERLVQEYTAQEAEGE
ncbi:hypothetical protein [Streptomyces sp. NPDC127098]|uniref:hypothetical protein n=1 Tax=Streptomyces sp. NPDC127098 TaxID=3347137 RepID=UPI0036567901